jgi:hypothetical protein
VKAKELVIYPVFLAWVALIFTLIGFGKQQHGFFIIAGLCFSACIFMTGWIIARSRKKKHGHDAHL